MNTESFVDRIAALAALAAKGDRASFVALVELTQQPLFRRAYVHIEQKEEAEDVVQEVLLQAWRSLPRLRDPQATWAWLCQMTYNVARDHRRKRKRTKAPMQQELSEETQQILETLSASWELTPEHQIIAAELSSLVRTAIEGLDSKHSEIIRLREFGQFSYQEIAEMLDCSLSAVESRLHRARLQLSRQLKRLLPLSLNNEERGSR